MADQMTVTEAHRHLLNLGAQFESLLVLRDAAQTVLDALGSKEKLAADAERRLEALTQRIAGGEKVLARMREELARLQASHATQAALIETEFNEARRRNAQAFEDLQARQRAEETAFSERMAARAAEEEQKFNALIETKQAELNEHAARLEQVHAEMEAVLGKARGKG